MIVTTTRFYALGCHIHSYLTQSADGSRLPLLAIPPGVHGEFRDGTVTVLLGVANRDATIGVGEFDAGAVAAAVLVRTFA